MPGFTGPASLYFIFDPGRSPIWRQWDERKHDWLTIVLICVGYVICHVRAPAPRD